MDQVRRALRLGMLQKGDQLPTVKDVVAHPGHQPPGWASAADGGGR